LISSICQHTTTGRSISPASLASAADQLAASLSPAQRAVLAAALSKSTAAESLHEDEEYVHHLFEAADIDGERGTLTK
jgi:hypothetical protein